MAFIDRLRLRLASKSEPEQAFKDIERFAANILGPFRVWSTTTNPPGVAALAWTGTTVDPTLGNGTLNGLWRDFGDVVWFTIEVKVGSTSAAGTGDWGFTLPVKPTTAMHQVAAAVWHTSVVGNRQSATAIINKTRGTISVIDIAGGSLGGATGIATNDLLIVSGSYATA